MRVGGSRGMPGRLETGELSTAPLACCWLRELGQVVHLLHPCPPAPHAAALMNLATGSIVQLAGATAHGAEGQGRRGRTA